MRKNTFEALENANTLLQKNTEQAQENRHLVLYVFKRKNSWKKSNKSNKIIYEIL